MSSIEFDYSEYEFSHARAPRGYGSWAFTFDTSRHYKPEDVVFAPTSTFADAKRWARVEAVRRNATLVRVCP